MQLLPAFQHPARRSIYDRLHGSSGPRHADLQSDRLVLVIPSNSLRRQTPMTSIRSIGRWALTALVINSIIGSAIFGLPSVLIRLLGTASPLALLAAALLMSVIMLCAVEVASHFSETGGAYLYVRTAFGRFAAVQIGWFWLLSVIGGGAMNTNLFMVYLSGIWPEAGHAWVQGTAMAALLAVPTIANYRGVRYGALLSSGLVVAKLLPLILLIVLGGFRFSQSGKMLPTTENPIHVGSGAWLQALLLLVAAYGAWDLALAPTGEVKRPQQTVPFALGIGLAISAALYVLVQFVILATMGTHPSDRPVADTASVLMGRNGALFVTVAVMLSTYGNITACILNAPRIVYALAANADAPRVFAKLHSRFHTPAWAIVAYASLVWLLAASGTFVWALALTAGSLTILYGSLCACLLRLRRLQPHAPALRVPAGRIAAVTGIGISVLLLTRMERQQLLLMAFTMLAATVNWWWAKRVQRRL
jgi:APA family basic amino acid/polyamine antiporter